MSMEIFIEFHRPVPLEDSGNYYELLGVPHNADTAAIKKAYRKLSLKHHPDKHSGKNTKSASEKKFVEIAHAFKVLSDPEQREIYDREGGGGLRRLQTQNHPMHPQQIDPFQLLNQLLGGLPIRRPGEAYTRVNVPLLTIYIGGSVDVQRKQRKQDGSVEEKTFKVEIPAGFPNDAMKKVKGAGDFIPGSAGAYGDLHVKVHVDDHPRFEREGRVLYTVQEISLVQSLLGVNVTLEHLDGHKVAIVTKPGLVAKHGAAMKLVGEGLPSYHGQGQGDLIVHFSVQFPETPEETLLALGVKPQKPPSAGLGALLSDKESLERCHEQLARLQYQKMSEPCSTAGKIPIGDWAASKVLKAGNIQFLPSAESKEL